MPDIAADRLTNVVAAVFRHAGCDDVESLRVADNLVTANLTGHDSHGVIPHVALCRLDGDGADKGRARYPHR